MDPGRAVAVNRHASVGAVGIPDPTVIARERRAVANLQHPLAFAADYHVVDVPARVRSIDDDSAIRAHSVTNKAPIAGNAAAGGDLDDACAVVADGNQIGVCPGRPNPLDQHRPGRRSSVANVATIARKAPTSRETYRTSAAESGVDVIARHRGRRARNGNRAVRGDVNGRIRLWRTAKDGQIVRGKRSAVGVPIDEIEPVIVVGVVVPRAGCGRGYPGDGDDKGDGEASEPAGAAVHSLSFLTVSSLPGASDAR